MKTQETTGKTNAAKPWNKKEPQAKAAVAKKAIKPTKAKGGFRYQDRQHDGLDFDSLSPASPLT